LEHTRIKNDGTLMISELKNKYLQRLKEKREKNKQLREAKRLDRERQKQESYRRNSYTPGINNVYTPSSNPSINSFSNFTPRQEQHKDDKAYYQEYKEYHFETIGNKEYLHITPLCENNEYTFKYLILEKQVEKNEMYLTCRKEAETNNIRYSIHTNSILDSIKKVRIQRCEMS